MMPASSIGGALATALLLSSMGWANARQQDPATTAPPPAQQQPDQQAPAQVEHPSQASLPGPNEATGAAPLRVMVGKSLLINTTRAAQARFRHRSRRRRRRRRHAHADSGAWPFRRRSFVADLGRTGALPQLRSCAWMWTSAPPPRKRRRVFPDEQITVTPSRSAIVLSGHVSTEDVAKRAGMIAEAYSKNVVNVLTFGPVGAQEVLLEVKFAEVDRSALTQLGIKFHARAAATPSPPARPDNSARFSVTHNGTDHQHYRQHQHDHHRSSRRPPSTITDFLNLFVARTDINIGAVIKALQQKNLLQILAEPNLIAVNGKEASFLAGGEFPFPIVQPGQGFTAVTISFKEFGVQAEVHAGDHAQREHPSESGAGGQRAGFRQCPDDFRIHRARAEHAQGGNRIRIAGRAELRDRRI